MEEYLLMDIYVSKWNNSLINGKMIGCVFGVLFFIEVGMFVFCFGIFVVYGESDYKYFFYMVGINFLFGVLLMFYGCGVENWLSWCDGYCIVIFLWVFFIFFGMLFFYLSGSIDLLINVFFEIMLGFIIMGVMIFDDIELFLYGMFFW